MNESTLQHWGIKGMKWGVRRYQNKDGSLTAAGQKRYDRDLRERADRNDKNTNYDAHRWVREDLERSKSLTNESQNLARNAKKLVDDSIKNTPKTKMDLSSMSDKEMRDAINRALLEKQYNDMFAPQRVSRGKEHASQILETAGNVLGVTGSALGIALLIKQLAGK